MSLTIKTLSPDKIYAINCGTSTPKLSGTIDITSFPSLTSITCTNNDIENFIVSNTNSSLANIVLSNNKLSGNLDLSVVPNIKNIDVQHNYNMALTNYGPLTGIEVIDARDILLPSLETLTNKPNARIINFGAGTANKYISLSGQFPFNLSGLTGLEVFMVNNSSLSGSEVVNLSGCTKLQDLRIQNNALTGPHPILPSYAESLTLINVQGNLTLRQRITGNIPPLSSFPNLVEYTGSLNNLSGEIPTLDYNPNLQTFGVAGLNSTNRSSLTKINSLSGAKSLQAFSASFNNLSGDLPYLGNNTALETFNVQTNSLTGGTIGPVLSTLSNFNASSNLLSQSTVNGILSSFAAAGRNSGTRVLNIGGTNDAPDFTTNCIKLTSARVGITNWPTNTFTRPASSFTVVANVSGHGLNVNDIITINNIGTGFNTTTVVLSVANTNRFTYTSPSSSTSILNNTASTTGRIYETLTSNTPLSSYQRLVLPTSLGGLGWTVTITFQQ